MPSNRETTKRVKFAYYVDHIPYRGRKLKRSWIWRSEAVHIRCDRLSEMQLARRIIRHIGNGRELVVDVYGDEQGLWWPIGDAFSDTAEFFNALEDGDRDALALMGVGFQVPLGNIAADYYDLMIRNVKFSSLEEMTTRAQIAAQNIRIIDDEVVYVRGGEPLCFFYRDWTQPDKMVLDIYNSGSEFGLPLPISMPANGKIHGSEQDQIIASIRKGYFCSPMKLIDTFEPGELVEIARVEHRLQNSLVLDHIELELQFLCRDLLNWLNENPNVPPVLLQGLKLLERRGGKPTTAECAALVSDFRERLRALQGPRWAKLVENVGRLIEARIHSVEHMCRNVDHRSPFAYKFESEDDEALARLASEL
jgi:hypothetical protein